MSPQTVILMNIFKFLIRNFKYIVGVIIVLYLLYDWHKTSKMQKFIIKIQNEKNINKTKEITFRTKHVLNKMIIDDINQKVYYISVYRNKLKNYVMREIDYKDILSVELVENRTYTTILVIEDIFASKDTRETLSRIGFRLIVNDLSKPQVEMVMSNSNKTITEYTVSQVHEWIAAMRVIINKVNS